MGRTVALLLGLLLSVSVVLAGVAQGTPAVGDERAFSDAEGETLGIITVEEVQDPFDDYAEGAEPDDDIRYVLLRMAFEATGESIFDAQPNAVLLQDADGVLWRPTNVRRNDATLPDLQSQPLSSGNRVSGAITFEIPDAAELAQVLYRPDSRRLIVQADLREGTDLDPGPGDEVTYASLENVSSAAVITVTEVENPFEDYAEGNDPEADTQYVAVTIRFESIGESVFEMNPNQIVLRDSQGFLWTPVNIRRGEDLTQPNLEGQPLAPGNIISGVVGFQIPSEAEISDLLLQPSNDQVITLARFQADAGGVNAQATP